MPKEDSIDIGIWVLRTMNKKGPMNIRKMKIIIGENFLHFYSAAFDAELFLLYIWYLGNTLQNSIQEIEKQ